MKSPFPFTSFAYTSPCGSGSGSGCRRMPLTIEKIAVEAPIPSASVVSTTIVNDGDLAYVRAA